MEINLIIKRIEQACGDNADLANMLKDLFKYQRQQPSWYKTKYKEIIEKYADGGDN